MEKSWFSEDCPFLRVSIADCTFLIADVVGDVDASLAMGELLAMGGLEGISLLKELFRDGFGDSFSIISLSLLIKFKGKSFE